MVLSIELLLLALIPLRVYARLFAVVLRWSLKRLRGNGRGALKASNQQAFHLIRVGLFSGARTRDGFPVMTFPDSRVQMSYPNYHLLVTYLLQVPP